MEVVEVVLSEAPALLACAGGVGFSHADKPAVVLANGLWEVATTPIEGCTEVVCTNIDVGGGIHTSVRGITAGALFRSNLHEPLLAIAADCVGFAGGLLHSDRSDENGRDAVLVGRLVEGIKVWTAGLIGVAGTGEGVVEVLANHLVGGEVGRSPARALNTTVEPADRAIGAASFGGIG